MCRQLLFLSCCYGERKKRLLRGWFRVCMLEMYCRFLSEGPCLYLESLQSSHLKWDRKSELYIPVSTFLLCKQGQHFFFCWQVTFKRSCEAHRSCGGQRLRNAKMGGVFFWRKAVSQEDRFGMDCYIYTKFEHVVKSNLSSWNSSRISWKKVEAVRSE